MNNSFFNSTSPDVIHDTRSRGQIILQASSMACIIIFSIFGNVLIFLAVYTNRHLQDVTSVFIVNLACADALLALIGMPFTLVSSITYDWIFGDDMCSFHGVVNFIFAAASIVSLGAVAIERYVAIIKPLKYHTIMSRRTIIVMVVYIWVHSLVGALLPLIGWSRYTYFYEESMCTYEWPNSVSSAIFVILTTFFVPLFTIAYCYYHILKVARDHLKRLVPIIKVEPCEQSTDTPRTHQGLEQSDNHKAEKKYKQEAKAAKTLMLVMGSFLFCWAPHIIGMIALLFSPDPWPDEFFAATTWLAMLNSACNPIIYGLLNQKFRESYKKILSCKRLS